MKLYEIEKAVTECLDTETGEIIDFEKLLELEMEKENKIDNIACWYKQLNAESAAIKTEIESLKERQKRKADKADSLKKFLTDILDGSKFETSRTVITWRKSDEVKITDESKIPAEFKREKTVIEPDKTAIKAAIKSNRNVDGAYIEYKNNISIK